MSSSQLPPPNKILGIIPARSGSRGVSNKNKKICAGKPLIQYTIDSAKSSDFLNKIVVTTDDNDIIEISKKNSVDVIKRPRRLATDKSLIIDTLNHVLSSYPETEIVVLLQPTSPIRHLHLIDMCIDKFLGNSFDCIVTGFECDYKPYDSYTGRRQDVNTFFCSNGNVYVLKSDRIKDGKINSTNYGKVYTSREENVEIDDNFDFWLVEQILEKRKQTGIK